MTCYRFSCTLFPGPLPTAISPVESALPDTLRVLTAISRNRLPATPLQSALTQLAFVTPPESALPEKGEGRVPLPKRVPHRRPARTAQRSFTVISLGMSRLRTLTRNHPGGGTHQKERTRRNVDAGCRAVSLRFSATENHRHLIPADRMLRPSERGGACCLQQLGDVVADIAVAEDGVACDEQVGAGADNIGHRDQIDAAVHFNAIGEAPRFADAGERFNF